MNDLKYVIVQLHGTGNKIAIIFNGLVNHNMVVQPPFVACSAGFCYIQPADIISLTVVVWGESISLGLKSDSEDGEIIKKTLERTVNYF